jgi:hypothetical protein
MDNCSNDVATELSRFPAPSEKFRGYVNECFLGCIPLSNDRYMLDYDNAVDAFAQSERTSQDRSAYALKLYALGVTDRDVIRWHQNNPGQFRSTITEEGYDGMTQAECEAAFLTA